MVHCKQCQHNTVFGQRCKRRVCKGFYCWQHSTKTLGLRVKKSTIPDAGFGLFTTRDFKKNHKIGDYSGTRMTKQEVDKKYNGTAEYVICDRDRCIDGSDPNSSFVRYINRSERNKQPNAIYKNMNNNHNISVRTTKRISKGSEIFTRYGRTFHLK